jgi:aminoglycoside phosphotransferase (APT) family kinase protein
MAEISDALGRVMARATGIDAPIENLHRLSGGANMESSAYLHDGKAYVLRRAPSAELMEGRAFGHDVEARIVRAAYAAGVKAPEIVAELASDDGIGTGCRQR